MAQGSPSLSLNKADMLNVLKHIGFVAAAAGVTALGQQVVPVVDTIGQPMATSLVAGLFTLINRWLADNA